jgi:predicted nucleic acid-binding protein
MPVLDASSALYAWDNYPLEQFPPLWTWVAQQITKGELTIPTVALEEVGHKSPACAAWLKSCQISVLPMTQAILMDALRIKAVLGVVGEAYGSGVGENDLFIIATARAHDAEVLSDEARQPSLPNSRRNYKIPAVCALLEVQTTCLSFVEYLKRSRAVFGA